MLLPDSLRKLKISKQPIFLGLSGGVDSEYLFDQLIQNNIKFTAIHIHHGLQDNANLWLDHCHSRCKANNIPFLSKKVKIKSSGKGIEAAAREARIEFFLECLNNTKQKCTLLLAHHLDDQIETFFLRLMRGASLTGLSAMRANADYYEHEVMRPLLEISKSQIIEKSSHLNWVDDPTNHESVYDRNFLRNDIFPKLTSRWPQYSRSIQQSIEHIQTSSTKLSNQLDDVLEHFSDENQLIIPLNTTELAQLIHRWLITKTSIQPNKNLIESLIELTTAKHFHKSKVISNDHTFIFNGKALCINKEQIKQAPLANIQIDKTYTWFHQKIQFKQVKNLSKTGLKPDLDPSKISIQLRPNNQKLDIFGRDKRRDLKRLLQELNLSWDDKQSLPFIFFEQNLIAIGDYFIVKGYASEKGSHGIEIFCK